MSFQSTIFALFGSAEKRLDTYKDSNNKGIMERFNECIGRDMDTMNVDIDSMSARLNDADVADLFTLGLICESNGLNYELLYKGNNIDVVRRIAKYSKSIVENRANVQGVKRITYIIMPFLDFVNVTEDFPISGFDSPITFDNVRRRFDGSGGNACVELDFIFDSPIVLSEDENETLRRIAKFNTPLDCRINSISLNGVTI